MSEGVSPGDLVNGAVGVAAGGSAFGFFRWLSIWTDRRAGRRDARLQAWEASLVAREKQYREEIEHQLSETRQLVEGLRTDLDEQRLTTRRLIDVVTDLSFELEAHAPMSAALRRARALLKTLPLPQPSADLAALAAQLDGGSQ